MKRVFLVGIAMIFSSVAVLAKGPFKYADLVVYRPAFKNYVAELRIDSNAIPRKSIIKNALGNKIKFASEVDALNHVVAQGWEVTAAYHNHNGGGTHFILKKAD